MAKEEIGVLGVNNTNLRNEIGGIRIFSDGIATKLAREVAKPSPAPAEKTTVSVPKVIRGVVGFAFNKLLP